MSNMVVQTNVLALNTHRNMKVIGTVQEKASAKLSSGYRINSAADDAAGLAISEKMRSQIRGLDQASRNAADAISLVQTAEGGMQEIDNMLQRIRELVVQVSNDTNEHNGQGTGDRQKIQDEVNELVEEIDSMADRVEFNKKKVINGTYADANEMLAFSQTKLSFANTQYAIASTTYASASVSASTATVNATGAATIYTTTANSYASAVAAGTGVAAAEELMNSAGKVYNSYVADVTKYGQQAAVQSAYRDQWQTNSASASVQVSTWSAAATAQTSPVGLYMQLGANATQGLQITIGSVKTDILGIGDGKGGSKLDVLQTTGIETTSILDQMDLALTYVTSQRSKLGAAQNRIEYTGKSLDISSENLNAAESRIRNADMAKEMMNLTKANVLQQAAVSMLAQANQNPQSILQLLR